jgi:hypothetical protein
VVQQAVWPDSTDAATANNDLSSMMMLTSNQVWDVVSTAAQWVLENSSEATEQYKRQAKS